MKFNINDRVIVDLTDFGKQILNKKAPEKLIFCHMLPSKKYKFQLWELMEIFGKYMYSGMPEIPFVNNEIEIKENKHVLP